MADMTELAGGLRFPEGPIAMADGSVVLVEMFGPRLTKVKPDGSTEIVAEVEGGPNGAAVGPDGAIYLCNNGGCFQPVEFDGMLLPGPFNPDAYIGGRVQRVDPTTGAVTDLYTECDGRALRAPNDLVMDGHGGFYFTDHGIRDHNARTSDLTGIYYGRCDGSAITQVVFPVEAPNGIGLSPDGDVLYWAETHNGRVFSRRVAGPGELVRAVAARPRSAVRSARLPVPRLARRRRRGLGLRGDDLQRRRHRDLARRGHRRAPPDRRPAHDERLLRRRGPADRLRHALGHRQAGLHALAASAGSASPTCDRPIGGEATPP